MKVTLPKIFPNGFSANDPFVLEFKSVLESVAKSAGGNVVKYDIMNTDIELEVDTESAATAIIDFSNKMFSTRHQLLGF